MKSRKMYFHLCKGCNCTSLIVILRGCTEGCISFHVTKVARNAFRRCCCNSFNNHSYFFWQDTVELVFEDVRLPKEALLGGEETLNKGFYLTMNQVPRERLILSVGVQAHSECMFEMTRDYVKQRKAFGRTLSNLQVKY